LRIKDRAGSGGRGESEIIPALLNATKKIYLPHYSIVAFWYQTGEPAFNTRSPHADKRRLPSLDKVLAARDYTQDKFHGQGKVVVQNLSIYPNGHLLYMPQSQDQAWLQIPFEIEKKKPLRLLLTLTRSYDFGKYQAYHSIFFEFYHSSLPP